MRLFLCDLELLTQQREQSEETVAKLKQLLMKGKKEVAEGKRKEEELCASIAALRSQLEQERQGSEQAKVEVSQVTAKIQSMKQQVRTYVHMHTQYSGLGHNRSVES